ncbi:LysR family transcriptional regulator [Labrys okinawensis]|uniref:LysR family transcriptional regulator n=1 Tax=Labrys okinawensis TaxID=346911 RepID=A0A2S9QF80_9HYPH|nr:LysR family transcriptional regulator [Labrys okinawensis]PRH88016.1 LysR family transcriptional regulator [Labrys okinawensis]
MNNLAGIDLNLLTVLEALLAERHVSRAALRLNRSQPAVSHALARLRLLFDDPLLVRQGGGLGPTARALEIQPHLGEALDRMRHLLAPAGFDPSSERRTFRLAMSDYGAAVLLPKLVPLLRTEAPHSDLLVTQASREAMEAQILDGEIDLALAVFPDLGKQLARSLLFEDRYVCLADAAGQPPSGGLDLAAYLARPHALVALRADVENEIDRALVALGHRRRICLTLPHWGVAPRLISGTNIILTVARGILPPSIEADGLRLFEPPFALPPVPFTQIWHPRRQGDPAHQWLRERIGGFFRAG